MSPGLFTVWFSEKRVEVFSRKAILMNSYIDDGTFSSSIIQEVIIQIQFFLS